MWQTLSIDATMTLVVYALAWTTATAYSTAWHSSVYIHNTVSAKRCRVSHLC